MSSHLSPLQAQTGRMCNRRRSGHIGTTSKAYLQLRSCKSSAFRNTELSAAPSRKNCDLGSIRHPNICCFTPACIVAVCQHYLPQARRPNLFPPLFAGEAVEHRLMLLLRPIRLHVTRRRRLVCCCHGQNVPLLDCTLVQ